MQDKREREREEKEVQDQREREREKREGRREEARQRLKVCAQEQQEEKARREREGMAWDERVEREERIERERVEKGERERVEKGSRQSGSFWRKKRISLQGQGTTRAIRKCVEGRGRSHTREVYDQLTVFHLNTKRTCKHLLRAPTQISGLPSNCCSH